MDAGRRIVITKTGHTLFVRECGPHRGVPVVCIPGISSTSTSFASLCAHLEVCDRRVVAIDLRGRGLSPATPAGSYGLPSHARDVAALIEELSAGPADIVGHSMGGFVAMALAALAPASVGRMVIVDALRKPAPPVLAAVRSGLDRLGHVYCSVDAYTEATMSRRGTADAVWEAHDIADLESVPGGVRSRTSREACFEDAAYIEAHDPRAYWPALPKKTLVVHAVSGFGSDSGLMVPQADVEQLAASRPDVRVRDFDANHYTILTGDAVMAAIAEHLT